jgi:hypothetical protein
LKGATAPEGAIDALAFNENSMLSLLQYANAARKSDSSVAAGQQALQGSVLGRT